MPCYNPFAGYKDYESGLTENGKWRYKINGRYNPDLQDNFPLFDVLKIPCGHCLGCRMDYSRKWADRMFLEFISCDKKAVFVTLTYNQDNVPTVFNEYDIPIAYTLDKRDCQLFMKSLRKAFPDKTIRFYLSGEYGGKTRRPHYHAILFGLQITDFPDRQLHKLNELGQPYFISERFNNIWKKGYTTISPVSYLTCAYVSRYTMKKAFNIEQPEGCIPEFSLMSRRPGIAGNYYKDHKEDVGEKEHIFFNDGQASYKISMPKYFLDKLKLTDQEAYDNLMKERRVIAHDSELLKLSRTDLSYEENLEKELNKAIEKRKISFKRREEFNYET